MTTQNSKTSNEPYRELKESRGSELNVNEQNPGRYNGNFEDNVDRSIELSSIVVIPDGMSLQLYF